MSSYDKRDTWTKPVPPRANRVTVRSWDPRTKTTTVEVHELAAGTAGDTLRGCARHSWQWHGPNGCRACWAETANDREEQ